MRFDRRVVIGMWVAVLALTALTAAAQNVSVTSAEPSTGEQETNGLQVRVRGRGFAQNPHVEFLLDDNSTGGIVVTGAQYVSSTEILATIDIAQGATLALFDIRVTTNGRTGRGSDLFQVVQKGAGAGCLLQPLPSNVSLVGELNSVIGGVPAYQKNLGVSMQARAVTIGGTPTVMVAARASSQIVVFFLSESAGSVVAGINPTRLLSASGMASPMRLAIGDVDADGLPDIVAASREDEKAVVFRGRLQSGLVDFHPAIAIPVPSPVKFFGRGVAVGDLDPSSPGDEIAVAQDEFQVGKSKSPGKVHLYRYVPGPGDFVEALTPNPVIVPTPTPTLKLDDLFSNSNNGSIPIAIADVTGTTAADLILLAPDREVGSLNNAGEVWVLPGPVSDMTPLQLRSAAPTAGDQFGNALGIADVDGDGELDILTATAANASARGEVVFGPVLHSQASNDGYHLQSPLGGLQWGLATTEIAAADLNGDGRTDIAIGAPNAAVGSSCSSAGAVHLFLGTGNPGQPWDTVRLLQAATVDSDFAAFGWTTVPIRLGTTPYLLVGEQGRNLGGVVDAGQIYIYRIDIPVVP
jgi:hypothetical protein